MAALLRLSSAIDRVNMTLGRLAAFLVLAAALISAGNAFVRYAFDTSSNAWLEIQWYLFGAIVLLGASETLRRNEHVRVDLIYGTRSERTKLRLDIGGIVVLLLPFALVMLYLSWPVAWQSFVTREGSTSAGGLIRWPFKMLLPLGFALLTLQALSELIKRVAALRGLVALDTAYHKPDQ